MKLFILFLLLITVWTAFSDRTYNVDLYLILDKSRSMDKKIGAVKDYIKNTIIEQCMIPRDTLTLIVFYGRTEIILSLNTIQEDEKQAIKEIISGIEADEEYTDIGNALDCLRDVLTSQPDTERRKHFMLITDGKQEAPKNSKYYSPDGGFNHEFLAITKVIRKQGWKIEILFIGEKDQNIDIMLDLFPGSHHIFTDIPTEDDLAINTEDMFRLFELQGKPIMEPIPSDGYTTIKLEILSKEINDPVAITIKKIRLQTQNFMQENLLFRNYPFIIQPDTTTYENIPVKIDLNLDKGKYNGELSFYFSGSAAFTPAISKIDFQVVGKPGMLWELELQGKPIMEPIPPSGKTVLKLNILSKEIKDSVAMTIKKIRLQTQNNKQENLLSSNYPFIAQPNTTTCVNIPVITNLNLNKGKYKGELSFYFSGSAAFTPAISEIDFQVIGETEIWWPIIIIICAILIIVLLIIIIILYKGKRITTITDDASQQKNIEEKDESISKENYTISKKDLKGIILGEKDDFFILFTGIDLKQESSELPSYNTKREIIKSFNRYLHEYLKVIPKKISIPREDISVIVFLFPVNESDKNEIIKCVFNLFLYKKIFTLEECPSDYIPSLKLCLHYGGIEYYSSAEKIASWDVSYTFKLGSEIKEDGIFQPDCIYFTEDAEKFIPVKLKQYSKETQSFRKKKIYKIGFLEPNK